MVTTVRPKLSPGSAAPTSVCVIAAWPVAGTAADATTCIRTVELKLFPTVAVTSVSPTLTQPTFRWKLSEPAVPPVQTIVGGGLAGVGKAVTTTALAQLDNVK